MRYIYDPTNGDDVTSSVQATLAAGRQLVTAYLYRWQFMTAWDYDESGSFSNYVFTDAAWPMFVEYCQVGPGGSEQVGFVNRSGGGVPGFTYLPEAFTVDKLSYGIGFEDKPAELTWNIDDTVNYKAGLFFPVGSGYTSPADAGAPVNLTLKQCFALGIFSEAPFWIHQAIYDDFPANGGNFLGTTLMFRGFVRGATATASQLKIKLSSLMDVFQDTKVPTQAITPNSRSAPYIPAASSPYGGDFSSIVFVGPQVLQFTTSEAVPANGMQDSWLVFNPATYAGTPAYLNGTPAAPPFRIQGNTATTGGSPQTITLYFYDTVVVPGTYSYLGFYSQASASAAPQGFLYVPPPEYSA